MNWIILIISLSTESSAIRMRVWRAIKAAGAAALRDGVYLLPARTDSRSAFEAIADNVRSSVGTTYLLSTDNLDDATFPGLFERSDAYQELLANIDEIRNTLPALENLTDTLKQVRKLRKAFDQLVEIDFFPGESKIQVNTALQHLELDLNRRLTPDEPHSIDNIPIPLLSISKYQGKVWATRCRPWGDRLASAWLIRRFIDPKANFLWLKSIADCPVDAIGFDFDRANFSHVGNHVTFEVLLMSFNLTHPSLRRIAALVHFMDVGGAQVSESKGVEYVLKGLRDTLNDDNELLTMASTVFDGLLASFENEQKSMIQPLNTDIKPGATTVD
jgi:hypothetical protein